MNDLNAINDWKNYDSSVIKMYKTLFELDLEGKKDSDEYKSILNILPKTIQIEKDIIKRLGINRFNFNFIYDVVSFKLKDTVISEYIGFNEQCKKLRLVNMLYDDKLNCNLYITQSSKNTAQDLANKKNNEMEIASQTFQVYYLLTIINNIIYLIENNLIKFGDNYNSLLKEIKYTYMATTVEYERDFIKNNCEILPIANFDKCKHLVDNYTELEWESMIHTNVFNIVIGNINYLLSIKKYTESKGKTRIKVINYLLIIEAAIISYGKYSFLKNCFSYYLLARKEYSFQKDIDDLLWKMFNNTFIFFKNNSKKGKILNVKI